MTRQGHSTELVEQVRHHLAISAIGPSAGRRMLREGEIEKVRDFLDDLDVERFGEPSAFRSSLDEATTKLARRLPLGRWGAARKFMNLYLRNLAYNFYTRTRYKLDRVEALLEIPLDSFAAKGLRSEPEGAGLPRWQGVIHLTTKVSSEYQAVALLVADRQRKHRVHLDLVYWRKK